MVKHIILWKLKEEYNTDEVKTGMKSGLEGLNGKIPGLLELKVQLDKLDSSNADVMLDSTFENETALKDYFVNPVHVKVANNNVRPFVEKKLCMDYYLTECF